MTIIEVVGLVKDILTVFAVLIGGLAAIFVYFQLAPVLELRILPRWTDDNKRYLVLRFEMENKSRVRLRSPWGRIQVLKYEMQPGSSLSHWIPFEQSTIRPLELPIAWSDPVQIFTSTHDIYPGETIVFERLYDCPEDTLVMHIGLQVGLKLGVVRRILTGKAQEWRQTTTGFATK